jgi:hypothetical protein
LRDRQQKGKQTDEQIKEASKAEALAEINFLESLKRVFATKDGEMVIKKLLRYTAPLSSPVDNSGKIGFKLGKQDVGKFLIVKLINAGCNLKITDFINSIDNDKLTQLYGELNKLNEEDK